jgi:hypothetical protein
MSTQTPPEVLLTHFHWSLQRFEEVLGMEKTAYYRDAALERFGFTLDRAMHCIRGLAERQGTPCTTHLDCLDIAEKLRHLDDPGEWRQLQQAYEQLKSPDKNQYADTIHTRLPLYYTRLRKLYASLHTAR